MSASFGRQDVTWNGSNSPTLTTSYVASDTLNDNQISLKYVKKFSVYLYYTPGAGGTGNSLQFQVQINPFYKKEDPTDLFWAPIGKYTDAAGTWTEEPATFTTTTNPVASTQYNAVPLDVIDPSAARVRVLIKETVVGGAAGKVRVMIGSNTIN